MPIHGNTLGGLLSTIVTSFSSSVGYEEVLSKFNYLSPSLCLMPNRRALLCVHITTHPFWFQYQWSGLSKKVDQKRDGRVYKRILGSLLLRLHLTETAIRIIQIWA